MSEESEVTSDQVFKRSLLEVWRELLSNIEQVRAAPIPVLIAHKTVTTWPKLSYQDTAVYHDMYHGILLSVRDVLDKEISEHENCLQWVGTEDLEHNGKIYKALLIQWNLMFDDLERTWRAEDPLSHIQVVAMVEARAFVFTDTGMVGHLGTLGFEWSNEDFMNALEQARQNDSEEEK